MRAFIYLLLLAVTASAALTRINDKNFKEVVFESGKFTFVDFYADWCRHCLNLMPTIEEVADRFADVPEIQVVKINGDEDGKKMVKKYEIDGFPAMFIFGDNMEPIEFMGNRDADSISNFIQQATGIKLGAKGEPEVDEGPSSILSLDDNNFEKLVLKADKKTVVSFTAPWCRFCKTLKPLFKKVANEIFDSDSDIIQFGEVELRDDNKDVVEKVKTQFGITRLPTILLFDPTKVAADGLKRPVTYNDEIDLEALVTFVNDETGLGRDTTGKLFPNAGRIMQLDEALKLLTTENGVEILQKLRKLEAQVTSLGRDALVEEKVLFYKDDVAMIPYYRKIINKVLDSEEVFFETELGRLQRIVANDAKNLKRETLDYMQKRINILLELVEKR